MKVETLPHTPAQGEEDSAKRRQIMNGARQVFMNLGFDGASMGEIARAAGVSKGTLYVYFTDKSRLFEAIVEDEKVAQVKASFNFDPAQEAEASLKTFGRAYIALLCRPEGGSAIRTVMAIAERMPDVGRRFYENVIAFTINNLAGFLKAKVESKELVIDDCEVAAAQFMQMCQATLFQPYIFQAKPSPTPERIAYVVDIAVKMSLLAYRAPK
jgi:AcrR family transcriptional regulator